MENDVLMKELSGFGENKNIFTVKMLASLFKLQELMIVKTIEENITQFEFGMDIKEVSKELSLDKTLRSQLHYKKIECLNNKKIYILSELGVKKLIDLLMIDLDSIAGKFLTDSEVKKLLKSIDQNSYVKEFERVLRPPRGKQGAEFKKLYIIPFFNKISEDVKAFLISSLEVQSLNKIPRIAYQYIIKLIEDGYTLSPELRIEFTTIHNQLMDLRQKVNEENRRSKESWFNEYSETELKQLIRVMNRYIE